MEKHIDYVFKIVDSDLCYRKSRIPNTGLWMPSHLAHSLTEVRSYKLGDVVANDHILPGDRYAVPDTIWPTLVSEYFHA